MRVTEIRLGMAPGFWPAVWAIDIIGILVIGACYILSAPLSNPVAGIQSTVPALVAPTPEPVAYYPAPPFEYDEIDMATISKDYWVCDPEVLVRGGPSEIYPILYTLHYGDPVRIGERSHGTLGWAMIGRAEWTWEGGLCPGQP